MDKQRKKEEQVAKRILIKISMVFAFLLPKQNYYFIITNILFIFYIFNENFKKKLQFALPPPALSLA